MTSDHQRQMLSAISAMLPHDRLPTEAEVDEWVERFAPVFEVGADETKEARRILHARYSIHMEDGLRLIGDDHAPWWRARQPEIKLFYWSRFKQHLGKKNLPPRVINATDRSTDEIIDLVGDPEKEGRWGRRGLVVGQVQSGKTNAYTALTCKAADAGYRVIILLTGVLESLRSQTQRRLDEGFVGSDSAELLKKVSKPSWIGVGAIDPSRRPVVLTSRAQDFKKSTIVNLGLSLTALKEPVLVVLKKNKAILEHLENWLRTYNADQGGRIDLPMLMIDDEADNASVNTASGDEATAINNCLRRLTNLFTRSSYVGFTATPFANIFIEADSDAEMEAQDLFPRHYLYYLDAPSNYVGPSRVFRFSLMGEDGAESSVRDSMTRLIEDAQTSFPDKHKSTLSVSSLPGSLYAAINAFVMANAVLDGRGGGPLHRSMLVNVSRFTNVQDQVGELIDEYIRDLQQDIRNYSQDPVKADQCARLQALKHIWSEEYADASYGQAADAEWCRLLKGLPESALSIEVRSVNQKSGASSLDYSLYDSTGLRVIAVGGNSLSRGLTLEGLIVSYFYRNSQMYDTLLQMGRWFGYRDGYLDVCRLWLHAEALQWYAHITEASEELRAEVLMMQQKRLKPIDFGLKVRAHPDTLLVTARNKMRSSQQIEWYVSVSEQYLETPKLSLNPKKFEANFGAASELIGYLKALPVDSGGASWQTPLWRGVPKQKVVDFLRSFQTHPMDLNFAEGFLADFLEKVKDPVLNRWDVFIPQGKEEARILSGLTVKPVKRRVELSADGKHLLVSGSHARVGERKLEGVGLSEGQLRAIDEEYRDKGNPPGSAYRKKRTTPLLILFLVKPDPKDLDAEAKALIPTEQPVVAVGLSFPPLTDGGLGEKIPYRVNSVYLRERFEAELDDDLSEAPNFD